MHQPRIMQLYKTLESHFGFLDWWPGDSKAEIVVGAILTQSASWKNVEKAIANLKSKDMIDPKRIANADIKRLEQLVRPSGFYRQKARRLRGFMSYVVKRHGSLESMFSNDASPLRAELLSINGIGNETADSIALYAAEKPIFVIDAYTRRILGRVYGTKRYEKSECYDILQKEIEASIRKDVALYKDFHAQFVELGKNCCRAKPLCGSCPLKRQCKYFKDLQQ